MMQPADLASTPDAAAKRLHNFSAGPGTLPLAVIEEVRAELPVFGDLGSSIMEVSHRSAAYTKVDEDAKQHLRDLLGLGDDWHILFLQGGASMQFHQVPLNFLPDGGVADYLVTGSWAKKALKEAVIVGSTRNAKGRSAASSEDAQFSVHPRAVELGPQPRGGLPPLTRRTTRSTAPSSPTSRRWTCRSCAMPRPTSSAAR